MKLKPSNNSQLGLQDEINTVLLTNKKNELILISITTEGNTDPYIFPNKILSTFKFIDKASKNDKICGGFAGIRCPTGYKCQIDGNYPDASGKCIIQLNAK